jgi:hypothetical protein
VVTAHAARRCRAARARGRGGGAAQVGPRVQSVARTPRRRRRRRAVSAMDTAGRWASGARLGRSGVGRWGYGSGLWARPGRIGLDFLLFRNHF